MAEKGLSATALSKYIADPIRFYKIMSLVFVTEELEESIAHHTLGTVIQHFDIRLMLRNN